MYIEPRVGFSWDVFKKGSTILRGGYGIFRAHDSYNDATDGQADATGARQIQVNQSTTLAAIGAINAPLSAGTTNSIATTVFQGFLAGDSEEPQVQTWDAAVVQQLPFKSQIQVAYVGSYSNHMLNNTGNYNNVNLDNINALPVGALYSILYSARGGNPFSMFSACMDCFIDYNLYYGGSNNWHQFGGNGPHDIVADPLYISTGRPSVTGNAQGTTPRPGDLLHAPATVNLQLRANSPAIGAGIGKLLSSPNASALATDILGKPRSKNGHWDLGAYTAPPHQHRHHNASDVTEPPQQTLSS